MSKQFDQKLKILYIKEFLEKYSSKANPVNANDIINYLNAHEINAERKSIYDDINSLINFGLDIVKIPGRNGGYYIDKRQFSKSEIRLIINALSSSKYINQKTISYFSSKFKELITYGDNIINKNIYVHNRVRNLEQNLFTNLDILDIAISTQHEVNFVYMEWELSYSNNRVEYNLKARSNGEIYRVYPVQIIFTEENYYLIAIELDNMSFKHFRIDKINNLDISNNTNQEAKNLATRFDPARYSNGLFDMFNGKEVSCKISFHKSLIGPMFERFGDDMIILKSEDINFYHTIQLIKISPKFFAWIISFSGQIKLLGSEHALEMFKAYLKNIQKDYSL